ncbi:MAG: hypothetical protein WC910_09790 [Bacteroidales bacterium]|jgi:hypothetical protein
MEETWTDESLKDYLKTIGFDGKMALLLASGNVQADLSLLVTATTSLAAAARDESEKPAGFVLTEADQAKILSAKGLLEEVLAAVHHRTGILLAAAQLDYDLPSDLLKVFP